jgi:nitrate reductase gamma subunit
MRSGSDTPQEPPQPLPPVPPHQSATIRAVLRKTVDALLLMELPWTLLATLLVLLSYLLDAGPALPWIGLALACLPFVLRLARNGSVRLRTRFDLPMVLLLTGALIGFCTSPDRTISLGALQSMAAFTLCYYSWVNHSRQATMVKWLILLVPVGFLIVLLLFLLDLRHPNSQSNFVIGGYGTHHGLAMYLVIVAAVLLGIAVFSRRTRIRVFTGIFFLLFTTAVLVMTWDSLRSLFEGESISGRTSIWERTADLLSDSPFTGLGLGCWAQAYWGRTDLGNNIVNEITHAHNGYLELYANTGILGALALLVALGIGAKLSLDIFRSPRSHSWYGFGVGVILACVATLLVAIVESAPVGVPLVAATTYYYIISPIAWILCGLLVIAHRLITKTPRL